MSHRQQLRCDRFALLGKRPQLEAQPEATLADPQWRSPARDLPARRRVVQRVLSLLRPHHAGVDAALLAKRVELALYSRAESLDEYAAPATLRRRVQALVAASVHEARAPADASSLVGSGRDRPHRHERPAGESRRAPKRRRLAAAAEPSACVDVDVGASPLLAHEDVTRAVCAFLDGKQVLRLRALNSLARAVLPSCVSSIRLEVSQLLLALDPAAAVTPLSALSNLRQLVVFKPRTAVLAPPEAEPEAEPEPSPAAPNAPLHAWSCAELAPTAANDGERAVCLLAAALPRFPKLRSLQLPAVFCNTAARNAARRLADALATGACPRLRDLVLGGNHLADAGALQLARALTSGRLPRLARLDLRRNYVGDRGACALLAALAARTAQDAPPSLRTLCLGGNLLTDASVAAAAGLVRNAQLAFLGLEDNFLTVDGVQRVVQSAHDR